MRLRIEVQAVQGDLDVRVRANDLRLGPLLSAAEAGRRKNP